MGRTQLRLHGAWIIIIARFIPGGRTATTYVAGTLEMPWKRRFLPADTAAAVLWSLYASALGYFGGAAFENNLWLPLLIAAGVSVLVAGAGELVRRKVLGGHKQSDSTGSRDELRRCRRAHTPLHHPTSAASPPSAASPDRAFSSGAEAPGATAVGGSWPAPARSSQPGAPPRRPGWWPPAR